MEHVQQLLSETWCFEGRSSEVKCAWKMPLTCLVLLVVSDFTNFHHSKAAFEGYDAMSTPPPAFPLFGGAVDQGSTVFHYYVFSL